MGDDGPGAVRFLAGFSAGSRIAGYRLEEQIGEGGMAVVFRARDERLHRQVALKILSPALAADEEFRRRFIRESRSAAAVDDPHIVPVFEAGEANGVLFIAMRYVPGGDAGTLVRRLGPLPGARAAAIISAVASALDRPMPPGWCTGMSSRPTCSWTRGPVGLTMCICPISGLRRVRGHRPAVTAAGHFMGTLDYSAPEQIRGQQVDARTDEYALACVAFVLLSGQPPFHRNEAMAVMYAHLSTLPPTLTSLRQELPPEVDEIMRRALAKAPEDRYPSCGEFADALRIALGLRRATTLIRLIAPHPQASADQAAPLAVAHASVTGARAAKGSGCGNRAIPADLGRSAAHAGPRPPGHARDPVQPSSGDGGVRRSRRGRRGFPRRPGGTGAQSWARTIPTR